MTAADVWVPLTLFALCVLVPVALAHTSLALVPVPAVIVSAARAIPENTNRTQGLMIAPLGASCVVLVIMNPQAPAGQMIEHAVRVGQHVELGHIFPAHVAVPMETVCVMAAPPPNINWGRTT